MIIKLLFFIFFIFILFIILSGVSILRFFFGTLFGKSKSNSGYDQQQSRSQQSQKQSSQSQSNQQKKIIDADEGEYVDYEEIKD